MSWNILKKCLENILKNCVQKWQHMLKTCQKFQFVLKTCWKFHHMLKTYKITLTWLWHDHFHQFWNIIEVIKIKTDIINVCRQLLYNLHATDIFWFNLAVNFLSNSVNLLGIFNRIKKLREFERSPYFWDSYLMPWTWNNELFWEYLNFLLYFSVTNMAENSRRGVFQSIISSKVENSKFSNSRLLEIGSAMVHDRSFK